MIHLPRPAARHAGHCINHILYNRGIYPAETFARVSQYGMTMFKTTDAGLNAYLDNVLRQLTQWLSESTVQKLVVVISSQESGEPLERWVFDCQFASQLSLIGRPSFDSRRSRCVPWGFTKKKNPFWRSL